MALFEKLYFISEHTENEVFHGGIGPVDIETILRRLNAVPLEFPHRYEFSLKAKVDRLFQLVRFARTIPPGSIVIFQHPLYATINILLIRILLLRPSIRMICILADIDGLKDGDRKLLQEERRLFKRFRYFIVHNQKMQSWLRSFHPAAEVSRLECFDFLTRYDEAERQKSTSIVFAGNLGKSRFLNKLHDWLQQSSSLSLNLYGPGITREMLRSANVTHKGVFNPYDLPAKIEGSFGLVWDGDALESPSGSLGKYMEFICHHKLSLYITSNLPVIVHQCAGSADLVKKFNIGFTVESLFEVEKKIAGITSEQYEVMVRNTFHLARKITSGLGTENALNSLIEKIEMAKT